MRVFWLFDVCVACVEGVVGCAFLCGVCGCARAFVRACGCACLHTAADGGSCCNVPPGLKYAPITPSLTICRFGPSKARQPPSQHCAKVEPWEGLGKAAPPWPPCLSPQFNFQLGRVHLNKAIPSLKKILHGVLPSCLSGLKAFVFLVLIFTPLSLSGLTIVRR